MSLLEDLIKEGEGLRLEFKEAKAKLPKSFYETVCAFLNREGGKILLGVSGNTRYLLFQDLLFMKIGLKLKIRVELLGRDR